MTNINRTPYLAVTINGSAVTGVLSAQTRLGYNLAVAQAEITLTALPAGTVPFSAVTITMGGSSGTASRRFTGYVTQIERELQDKTVKLVCRGDLQKAESYCAETNVDMSSFAVGWTAGHTDQTMVSTILYIVGLWAGPPSGETAMTGIGGTSLMLGTTTALGNGAFTWDTGTSGLSFIQKLDGVCLGYRTFELADGSIVRQQISALPAVSADYTFTEAVDIYRANAVDTILEAKNRIKVNGYQRNSHNKKETEVTYTADATNSWLAVLSGGAQWYVTEGMSSGMIEKINTADAGDGLSCEAVANWLLAELNVRRIKVTLTTYRDDNVSPGDTIAVAASTRLGVNQNFWVQEVACEVSKANQFTQTFTCIGVVAEPA